MAKATPPVLKLLQPAEKPAGFFAKLRSLFDDMTGEPKTRRAILPLRAVKRDIPAPWPNVVPETYAKKTLAMDSSITAMNNFAYSYGGWDQASFMGYSLLAELSQITEFRRPAEILANEMTRKWGELKSTSDDPKTKQMIKDLTEDLKKFKVREVFNKAFELDNFFGIGHVYIDIQGANGDELLNPLLFNSVKIAKGSLKEFRTVEPMWTYPNLYNANNPLEKDFYNPRSWFVMGTEVDRTRMMRFITRPIPDMLKPSYLFGGISLTQLMFPYVENWLRTRQSVSSIISNFSTPVLKTDMDQMTNKNGAANLALRANIYNAGRDNQGLLICDFTKEDFKIEAAPIAGLGDLQSQAIEQMAFPAGIPLVKLFGVTPSGLNASSDGEIRTFYDGIASVQERIGSPNMKVVIDLIQLNRYGTIDPGITWEWAPLWELDEEKLAAKRKTEAEVDIIYLEAGIIDPQAVLTKITTDPDSPYAGLDLDLPEPGMGEGEEGSEGEEGQESVTEAMGSMGPRQLITRAQREGLGPEGEQDDDRSTREPNRERPRNNDRNEADRQLALTGTRENETGEER